MNYASPGTIIHGTLRDEDLLDAFAATLEDCITKNPELWVEHRQNLTALVWDAREAAVGSEMSGELINDLIDALQKFAPPGPRSALIREQPARISASGPPVKTVHQVMKKSPDR